MGTRQLLRDEVATGNGMLRDISLDQFGTRDKESYVLLTLPYPTVCGENTRHLTAVTERHTVAVGDGMQRAVIQTVVGGTVCRLFNGVFSVTFPSVFNDVQCASNDVQRSVTQSRK